MITKIFKMYKSVTFLMSILFALTSVQAQSFTNGNALLPSQYHSGGCVGFTDMDGDGFDDLVVLDDSEDLHVLYQGADGTFTDVDYGQVSGSNQWGMCVADYDNDGHKDVFSGGSYDGVHVQHITSPGVNESFSLEPGSMFMQACSWADINNDGYLDVFACHDDALSRIWMGNADGSLTPAPALMPLEDYALADNPGNDHSGNYGTVFCDFDTDGDIDLFIAKCRQFVNDPYDPRRINQLWVNDGNGNFTEEALERGLVFYEQSWTVDFADIDNDGDFDCLVTNHSTNLYLLENDGSGYFSNITADAGLEVDGFFLQAKMEDFDNDGYVDLVYSGGAHRYYHNNGDKTFSHIANTFPGDDTMHSLCTGDVNRDGQVDLYASYGGGYVNPDPNNPDVLWVNEGNDNHWITFELEGIQSNVDAVGAKVIITGAFGTQIREVRAGESYGITCAATCHFGLGTNEIVETATIQWPSGLEMVIDNPSIDQYHTVSEAPCLVELEIEASAIEFCPGETINVAAPEGYATYLWSNGEEGVNEISVSESGNYSLLIYDADGCAGSSNVVSLVEIEGQDPTIELSGSLALCDGGVILMTSSNAEEWQWSNGETEQTIEVTSGGTYSVSVVDICGNTGSSEEVVVELYEAPNAPPTVSDITINSGDDASFTAEGTNVKWYDSEFDGNQIGLGSTYTQASVTSDLTVWTSQTVINTGELVSGGEILPQDGGQFHSNSQRWLEFDVYENILLRSVMVYADGEYERTFQLIDADENVLEETTVFVEENGFELVLNYEIAPGENYGLRSTTDDPQLWREGTDSELNYPYDLGGLASITNSTAGPEFSYYYFFYEWDVEPLPIPCESTRVSATASIVGLNELELVVLDVYPNPVSFEGVAYISNMPNQPCVVDLTDLQGRVVFTTNSNEILLDGISAGTYVVTVSSTDELNVLGTTKLVVQ